MSMGSWYILITKLYESLKISAEAKQARSEPSSSRRRCARAPRRLKNGRRVPLHRRNRPRGERASRRRADREHRPQHLGLDERPARLDDIQSRLQDGLAFLATVGSTAPFVGLFGTVWGIYHALTAIGIAGQASIDKVAGPVGEALIMTAIGLAVAVPAVLGYNWLVRRNKVTMESVRRFGADLHGVLLGARMAARAERRSDSQPGAPPWR